MQGFRKRFLLGGIPLAILAFAIGTIPQSLHYNGIANDHYNTAYPPAFWHDPQEEVDRVKSIRDWHLQMERKYRRAAFLPWFPVEPDPPLPILP